MEVSFSFRPLSLGISPDSFSQLAVRGHLCFFPLLEPWLMSLKLSVSKPSPAPPTPTLKAFPATGPCSKWIPPHTHTPTMILVWKLHLRQSGWKRTKCAQSKGVGSRSTSAQCSGPSPLKASICGGSVSALRALREFWNLSVLNHNAHFPTVLFLSR